MVFSSVVFLFLFFPAVLILYFFVKEISLLRNLVLLFSSLLFYFWGEGAYTLVMLMYIVFNFISARMIERYNNGTIKGQKYSRFILTVAVVFNLGFLLFYKYMNFFLVSIFPFLSWAGIHINPDPIHLPIGISFFTFQAISYVVDVYRGDIAASKSIINFAMYKSFFPQLIAGPIVRYKDVASQISNHSMNVDNFTYGIKRFILGLGKKVIIANTVASVADQIFAISGGDLSAPIAWLGILCYSLQIYFDFSGYSDMAIGMGRMFGLKFLENFNYPYISKSIKEFWRRWHISLSSWFRDYLYIPLGGNRVSKSRLYFNQIAVFFLCGLWHGASWTFVVWGLWHGIFLVIEKTRFGHMMDRAWAPFSHLYALLVIMIGWVFFRADTLSSALVYLSAMAGLSDGNPMAYQFGDFINAELVAVVAAGFIASTPCIKYVYLSLTKNHVIIQSIQKSKKAYVLSQVAVYSVLFGILGCSVMLLASGTHNPFIYFRF